MSRAKLKQTYRIDAALVKRVADRARERGVSRTEVIEAALAALLSPDHEERIEAMLSRRLDRILRQQDRLQWHVELGGEALALFVRHWLTNTSPLPDAALASAQASGSRRWDSFVDALARRMEGGTSFHDQVSKDIASNNRA